MKNDYADFLSPMLVKELRQGVRNRTFLSTFIFLQVAMLLTMVGGLLSSAEFGSEGSTVFFWVLVGASVLLVLPMSGMNAVGGEIRANTLELIFLTRLTSLRIVAGKWLAIFASSVLLVCAVLPYLVLRYFIGGVNIVTELIALFSILGGSALLTAITVGLSAYQTRLARGFLGLFVFFALQGWSMPFLLFGSRGSVGPSMGFITTAQMTCLIIGGMILILLVLDMGAAKIAPVAENHPAIQRSLALALLALSAGALFLRGTPAFLVMASFLLAILVSAVALCEQPRPIPSLYRPFASRGFLGRFSGRFLYPGWHTGIWFATLIFAGYAAVMHRLHMLDGLSSVIRLTAVFGTLLLPVAFTRLFFPKTERPLVIFFVVQIVCIVGAVLCILIDETIKTRLLEVVGFLPVGTLIRSANSRELTSTASLFVMPLLTLASWFALVIQSFRAMAQTRALEKASLAPEQFPAPTDAALA